MLRSFQVSHLGYSPLGFARVPTDERQEVNMSCVSFSTIIFRFLLIEFDLPKLAKNTLTAWFYIAGYATD